MGLHVNWAFALVLACGCNQVFGLDPPSRESVDARDHDAVVVDAAGDRDMDGVIDADDVCPDAADPGQFDEDGDGRGDRCDLCPYLNQNDDVDSEEDGIPDACDPYPMMSGGRLRFSGFHTLEDLDAWTPIGGGAVELENDAAHILPVLDSEVKIALPEDDNRQTLTRVIADIELETPNAGASARRAVGLVTNMDPVTRDSSFLCQLETDLPVIEVRLAEYRFAAGIATPVALATISNTYPAGHVQLEFDVGIDGSDSATYGPQCKVTDGGGVHALGRTASTSLAPGQTAVRTVGVPIRVNWIAIIDHQ